jgi:hypothetical protein
MLLLFCLGCGSCFSASVVVVSATFSAAVMVIFWADRVQTAIGFVVVFWFHACWFCSVVRTWWWAILSLSPTRFLGRPVTFGFFLYFGGVLPIYDIRLLLFCGGVLVTMHILCWYALKILVVSKKKVPIECTNKRVCKTNWMNFFDIFFLNNINCCYC